MRTKALGMATAGGLLVGAGVLILLDYKGWRALGKGGLPSTPRGWLTMTRLRFAAKNPVSLDVYNVAPGQKPSTTLLDLAERRGPRPRIAPWPIPHRQLDQFVSDEMKERLSQLFDGVVGANSAEVDYKMSFYEKHSPAITLRHVNCDHPHASLGEGEVAHIHPSDGSMHMIFSEVDAREVISRRWGERHPLAGVIANLPTTYLYIYPPRDNDELLVVDRILRASIAHMAGKAHISAG